MMTHKPDSARACGSFSVWHAADRIATLFGMAYQRARAGAAGDPDGISRLLAERDHAYTEAALLEREVTILRGHRLRIEPKRRPHYDTSECAQFLQLMRLWGWSAKDTASRFGLHSNTIRNWKRALRDKRRSERVLGAPPWNKLDEAVRWAVREIRSVCPEPSFGADRIARSLVRAGIRISRTSVRRILESEPKPRLRQCLPPPGPVTKAPASVQHPAAPRRVWYLDITHRRVLWRAFEIAAILDGFSRKIVAMKVYPGRPTTSNMARLVEDSIRKSGGGPRFLVTDHGGQFMRRFRARVESFGLTHVRCNVGTWQLNAKVERLFRDVKAWVRGSLLVPDVESIQSRLDSYRAWHNVHRPHAAHVPMTPTDAELGTGLPASVSYRQRGEVEPTITIERRCVDGDRRLFYPVIRVRERHRRAA